MGNDHKQNKFSSKTIPYHIQPQMNFSSWGNGLRSILTPSLQSFICS